MDIKTAVFIYMAIIVGLYVVGIIGTSTSKSRIMKSSWMDAFISVANAGLVILGIMVLAYAALNGLVADMVK